MHLDSIERDFAFSDVLRAIKNELSLVGHRVKGDVVDGEQECVGGHVVVDCDFPSQLAVLQCDGKHAGRGEFLASYRLLQLFKLDFEVFSLLLVGARDHVPLVFKNSVKVDLPRIGSVGVHDFMLANLHDFGNLRQRVNSDTLLPQGHLLALQVVPDAETLLAGLEHNLDWLVGKFVLGHVLDASLSYILRCILFLAINGDIKAAIPSFVMVERELDVQVGPILILDAEISDLAAAQIIVVFSGVAAVGALSLSFSRGLLVLAIT